MNTASFTSVLIAKLRQYQFLALLLFGVVVFNLAEKPKATKSTLETWWPAIESVANRVLPVAEQHLFLGASAQVVSGERRAGGLPEGNAK